MATELPLATAALRPATDQGGCCCDSDRARRTGRGIARMMRQVELAVGEVGLTLSQYRVLAMLDHGCDVASRLAEKLAVSKPSITGVIDGLVSHGFVERRPSDHDRRRVDLEITAAGRDALSAGDTAIAARADRIEELIGELRA